MKMVNARYAEGTLRMPPLKFCYYHTLGISIIFGSCSKQSPSPKEPLGWSPIIDAVVSSFSAENLGDHSGLFPFFNDFPLPPSPSTTAVFCLSSPIQGNTFAHGAIEFAPRTPAIHMELVLPYPFVQNKGDGAIPLCGNG